METQSARRTHRGLDYYITHSKQLGTKQAVLEMEAPEELRSLARDELRRIAVRGLKARGPRMDAVFYLLDALRLFCGKSLPEIQEITFEIGMLGKYGLDINSSTAVQG